jgi:hypothetical protein
MNNNYSKFNVIKPRFELKVDTKINNNRNFNVNL